MENRETAPRCEFLYVHQAVVDQVIGAMPGEEELFDLAELFKVFGDSTRIRILYGQDFSRFIQQGNHFLHTMSGIPCSTQIKP